MIVFLDAAPFLGEAIDSVLAQTFDAWELVLVDDGSSDSSTAIAQAAAAARPAQVRYVEHAGHANLGKSASRNLGISGAVGEYITFLDADDALMPRAFEEELAAISAHPLVAIAYGRFERWFSWTGKPSDAKRDALSDSGTPTDNAYEGPQLLSLWLRNESAVPANCSLILRRAAILQVGGFEEAFSRVSDDDLVLYSKILLTQPAYVASGVWGRYRQHRTMSVLRTESAGLWHATRPNAVRQQYLFWLDSYMRRNRIDDEALRRELNRELLPYRHPARHRAQARAAQLAWPLRRRASRIGRQLLGRSSGSLTASPNPIVVADELGRGRTTLSWTTRRAQATEVRVGAPDGSLFSRAAGAGTAMTDEWVVDGTTFYLQDVSDDRRLSAANTLDRITVSVVSPDDRRAVASGANETLAAPPVGRVRFGDLERPVPISRDWGFERGKPVDRWYIERFLAARAADIRGRVLEVGDDTYTRTFGGERVDRSDVLNINPGVLATTIVADLADAPQIDADTFDCIICIQTLQLIYDLPAAVGTLHRILRPGGVLLATLPGVAPTTGTWRDTTYWKLTPLSAQRLFGDTFGAANVTVGGSGNALSAVAHLHGLTLEDVGVGALEWREEGYEISISVRAVKARAGTG